MYYYYQNIWSKSAYISLTAIPTPNAGIINSGAIIEGNASPTIAPNPTLAPIPSAALPIMASAYTAFDP